MRILREWFHRLRGTLRPGRRDEELAEELRIHQELAAERGERVTGAARAMDELRDQRGLPWLEDALRDVRYGLRMLRRYPAFTATALLSLALGIGANTGIFSLVDHVLLRPLPVRDPERLVQLAWQGNALSNVFGTGRLMSYPLCRDVQQEDFFDGVFCRAPWSATFSTGGPHEVERVEIVSGSYFQVLGIEPALGRLIGESDDVTPAQHPVVVLSHDYWQNELGGTPDVVGRRVLVNNYPMTVIGVAAPGFRGIDLGEPPAFWVPTMMTAETILEFDSLLRRRSVFVHVFGRLKPGRSIEETRRAAQPWFASMLEADTRREDFPQATDQQRREFLASTLDILPAPQGTSSTRQALSQPLLLLMAGTTLLLLLACLNVAGLMLARGLERTREIATRMALGASRRRISSQMLVEGLLIALGGGLLGLAAAPLVSSALLFFLPAGDLAPEMDGRIFLYAFLASLATGALCAMAPAVQATRKSLIVSMQQRGHVGAGGAVRVRKALVVAQLAVTLLLLVGAGVFVQTLAGLYTKDRGFDSSRLVLFRADAAGMGYSEPDAARVMRDLLAALRDHPDIDGAALANRSLLTGSASMRTLAVESDGRVPAPVTWMRVSPGFFSTVGARLIAGREFDERDTRDIETTGFRSVIVNETFARRYFGDRPPVGQRVGNSTNPDAPLEMEIVGIVDDFSQQTLRDDEPSAQAFFPFADAGELAGDGTFYLRLRGEPDAVFASIRAAVGKIDPTLPLINLRTFDDQVDRVLQSERMLAALSSGFGAIALMLSVVGLYGVMSFAVTQRTQEIGMRLALGATGSTTVWLVIREALTMIAAGAAVAVPAAIAIRRLLDSEVYGLRALDGLTISMASGGLAFVALGAAAFPAWRAALFSPMVAIRDESESLLHMAHAKARQAMQSVAASTARADVRPITLIGEFTGLVQRATSFPEALAVALPMLRERVGAEFLMLLEKAGDEYTGADLSIPARGVLLNRLSHYPHPLPIVPGELEAWQKWAGEFRPGHIAEVERLRGAGVRMAVALRTKREIVGVLLLGAPEGRARFGDSEKQLLGSAAEVFALMIENARLNDRALEQEKVRRDLALAAEVQRRLLPPQPPSPPAATLAALTLPARTIGGDFYDFLDLGDGRIGIAVADISGKGIAAALLTSAVQVSMRTISSEADVAPSQLAAKMNRILYRSTASNSYATFFYAELDAGGRRLRYVNAGHNPPYLVRRTRDDVEVFELTEGGMVLGLFPELEYDESDIELRPGDLLVVFTDGVTEARRASGEEFGEERLLALLRNMVGSPAELVSARLADQMRDWTAGAEQHDDLTFVVAAISESAAGVA